MALLSECALRIKRLQVASEEIPTPHKEKDFSQGGQPNVGRGCPEMLRSLQPWRHCPECPSLALQPALH